MKKRQSVLGGSLLLMAAVACSKLLGACFRIPLTALLGGEGMGYFSSAYGLFLPVFSLSVTGMNTALAAQTAKLLSQDRTADAEALRRLSIRLFGWVGAVGSMLLYAFAEPICTYFLHNRGSIAAVRCFSPAIFFCCISAALRGAHEGFQDMRPTACSEFAEGVVKLFSGLFFCRYVINHDNTVLSFFSHSDSLTQLAAAAAILGVTCSTVAGLLTLLPFRLPHDSKSTQTQSNRQLLRGLMQLLLPISAAAMVTNLTAVIDLATGMRGLEAFLRLHPDEILPRLLPAQNANFLYGAFSGLAVTVFSLVPSVTNMLGKGVLPAFANAHAAGDIPAMQTRMQEALRPTAFLAIPAGLGIAALPAPILTLLFSARPAEVAIAAKPLIFLGFALIPLALAYPLMSMLQAADAAPCTVLGMLFGAAVKLFCNLLLIPRLGVIGIAVSTMICDTVIFLWMLVAFRIRIRISTHLLSVSLPYLFGGTLCALAARYTYFTLLRNIPQTAALFCAICTGGAIYLAALFLLHKKAADV